MIHGVEMASRPSQPQRKARALLLEGVNDSAVELFGNSRNIQVERLPKAYGTSQVSMAPALRKVLDQAQIIAKDGLWRDALRRNTGRGSDHVEPKQRLDVRGRRVADGGEERNGDNSTPKGRGLEHGREYSVRASVGRHAPRLHACVVSPEILLVLSVHRI